jgi:hypothetical protein
MFERRGWRATKRARAMTARAMATRAMATATTWAIETATRVTGDGEGESDGGNSN